MFKGQNGMVIQGTEQLKFAIFLPIEKFNTRQRKCLERFNKDVMKLVHSQI